ncbi:hypothetical protein AB4Y43_20545 [Paraburkholderia sp. BR10872]|uniref:hypothetical protein n=1 Tax=Paraburkholderia sp. BR10872 TaxID=3236989 RepID=UPI0034D29B37
MTHSCMRATAVVAQSISRAAPHHAHHNATLSNIRSFGPKIGAMRTGEIAFEPVA